MTPLLGNSDRARLLAVALALWFPCAASASTGVWSSAGTVGFRENHGMLALNNVVYVAGGDDFSSPVSDVQYALVSSGVGTFSTTSALSGGRGRVVLAGSGAHLYAVFGGNSDTSVLYATQQSGGALSAWTATAGFTNARDRGAAFVANGRLYVAGGSSGSTSVTYFSDVQSAAINSDGTLGQFRTESGHLPAGIANFAFAFDPATNAVFFLGGTNGTVQAQISTALISASDGSVTFLTTSNVLPTARAGAAAFVSGNYLYVLGGTSSTGSELTEVWAARIGAEGALGAWSQMPSFSGARTSLAVATAQGGAFLSGGASTSPLDDVQQTAVSNPGVPAKLAFTGLPGSLAAGVCSGPFSVELRDSVDLASWSDDTTLVGISASGAVVHGVSGCGDSGAQQVVITPGSSAGFFWLVASANVSLDASSSPLTSASASVPLGAGGGDGGTGADGGSGSDGGNGSDGGHGANDGGHDDGGAGSGSTDDARSVNGFGCSTAPLGSLAGLVALVALWRRRRR